MKTAIIVNLSKQEAVACAEKIALLMLSHNAQVYMLSEYSSLYKGVKISYADGIDELFKACDVAITVGGDGTILSCVRAAADFGIPIFGINAVAGESTAQSVGPFPHGTHTLNDALTSHPPSFPGNDSGNGAAGGNAHLAFQLLHIRHHLLMKEKRIFTQKAQYPSYINILVYTNTLL